MRIFDDDIDKFDNLKELKLWRHEIDVPGKKHVVKMLMSY